MFVRSLVVHILSYRLRNLLSRYKEYLYIRIVRFNSNFETNKLLPWEISFFFLSFFLSFFFLQGIHTYKNRELFLFLFLRSPLVHTLSLLSERSLFSFFLSSFSIQEVCIYVKIVRFNSNFETNKLLSWEISFFFFLFFRYKKYLYIRIVRLSRISKRMNFFFFCSFARRSFIPFPTVREISSLHSFFLSSFSSDIMNMYIYTYIRIVRLSSISRRISFFPKRSLFFSFSLFYRVIQRIYIHKNHEIKSNFKTNKLFLFLFVRSPLVYTLSYRPKDFFFLSFFLLSRVI